MLVAELATVVAAIAAVVAVWFAYRAAAEAHALRREERLARLPELVGDLGDVALRMTYGATFERHTGYAVARLRLEAALVASGEDLPRCAELVAADYASAAPAEVTAAVEAALDELADRSRPARSRWRRLVAGNGELPPARNG